MFKRSKGNLTENRLILLYLASRFPAGIEHDEVVKLNMQYDWMLYFDLEQFLIELCEQKLLGLHDLENRHFYRVTAEGLNLLDMYRQRIPLSIRTAIDEFVRDNTQRIERQMEIYADYTCVSDIDYEVKLRIYEYFRPIMSMTISSPSEAHAKRICQRFQREAPEIFAQVVGRLTRDDKLDQESEHGGENEDI